MRGSGTLMAPRFTWPRPDAPPLWRPVSALKRVVLPDCAKPTSPAFMAGHGSTTGAVGVNAAHGHRRDPPRRRVGDTDGAEQAPPRARRGAAGASCRAHRPRGRPRPAAGGGGARGGERPGGAGRPRLPVRPERGLAAGAEHLGLGGRRRRAPRRRGRGGPPRRHAPRRRGGDPGGGLPLARQRSADRLLPIRGRPGTAHPLLPAPARGAAGRGRGGAGAGGREAPPGERRLGRPARRRARRRGRPRGSRTSPDRWPGRRNEP